MVLIRFLTQVLESFRNLILFLIHTYKSHRCPPETGKKGLAVE